MCCDLDGVIWRGDESIPGSADAVRALRDAGARLAFLTNNSNLTIGEYLDKLAGMGVDAQAAEVLSSAQAAAGTLARELPADARVLVCAGAGVRASLSDVGLHPVDDGDAAAVVVGWHREFDFDRLARAAAAVRAGARFLATNTDATYPTPEGLLPGSGAIVAAVAAASGREPEVVGKPEAATVAMVRQRLGDAGIVIGDRASTDGALAHALGWPFALVLSGVTTRAAAAGEERVPDPAPPFVAENLAALVPELVQPNG